MLIVKTIIFALVGGLLNFVGLPYLILWLTRDFPSYDIGAFKWLGTLPMLLGITLLMYTAYSLVHFGRGTPAPFDPPKILVVKGPYKSVRNPGYLGAVAILLGESVVLQSYAVLIYALIVWLLLHIGVVLYEEPGLRKRFGHPYQEYCKTVPRWIPRLPGRRRIS